MNAPHSPKRTLMLGAAWSVGTRWSIKGIGFINTVIMARLLVPADYGAVAMAMLVVGLIQAFMDFGTSTALLRKGEVTRDEIDSAWSLRVMQGTGIGLILLAVSPVAAFYFKEPRVEYILWVLAACLPLAGASNMGMTLAQKKFNFSLEFKVNVIGKLLGVVATITAGYFLRDYRALVIGIATGYASGFFVSYLLHSYRPRWNTSKIGEIWAVTKWLMLAGIAGFILRKGDELIAAKIGTAKEFGQYNVGADLGQLPAGELGPAMLKAFLPVLAAMRTSTNEINNAVIKTIAAVNTITLPVGFGFAAIAVPATNMILGPAWSGAVQFVAAFAIASTLPVMQSPFSTLLVMRGYTKIQSIAVWLEFLVFLVLSAILVPKIFLIGLVWSRILAGIFNLFIQMIAAKKYCELSLRVVSSTIARPLIGSILMFFAVDNIIDYFKDELLQIIFGIAGGGLIFTFWSILTWLIFGRPEGFESTVLDYLNGFKSHKNN